jgi:dTDP-4-dehydrorhamnose 3,5-epimerase
MKLIDTPFEGLYIIQPKVFSDSRGYFFESYSARKFKELGLDINFVQDNESFSDYGVIRGLHYQLAPYTQAKLVRTVRGSILDVAVDIRKNSRTYGKHFAYELNDKTKEMLLIPRGFAHGFSVLSETAIVNYKCDRLYENSAERGVRYNDPTIAINWRVEPSNVKVSAKVNVLPLLGEIEVNFV